ncbi:Hydroxylase/desaturase asaB, partial [Pseudocercospora fuligena]
MAPILVPADAVINSQIKYYQERPPGAEPLVHRPRLAESRRMPFDERTVPVTDLRATSNPFTLDANGFQFLKYNGQAGKLYDTFESDDKIRANYYEEARELVKNATGATFVHLLGHVVRRDSYQKVLDDISKKGDNEPVNLQHPAMIAHLLDRLQEPIGDDLRKRASRSRWAIINVWKPLKTITREPLAVCDAETVSEDDLRAVKLEVPKNFMFPDGDKIALELWHVAPNERHRWYYPKSMEPDEALLIKCFDSRIHDGTARRAPHSAIRTPHDHGDARESIELRTIVFWDNQAKL